MNTVHPAEAAAITNSVTPSHEVSVTTLTVGVVVGGHGSLGGHEPVTAVVDTVSESTTVAIPTPKNNTVTPAKIATLS